MARGGAGAGGPPADARLAREGARLAGRYRLEGRLSERDGSLVWKATDEVLARPVAVHTFPPGFRRTGEVVAAARAACRLSDPRLIQIFDADDRPDHPYIVTELASGSSLGDLLAAGPLGPLRAAEIIGEAADALAAAHAAGLAHLCLTPDSLWCNARGEVKISGLATAAALTGAHATDPALADTQGLARLLYAALTGCWPGPEKTTLPPAPQAAGRACGPGQVQAGIPPHLDEVTCRALFGEADGDGPPILGPAQLAMELASITRPGPQPLIPSGSLPAVPAAEGPLPPGWVPVAAATPVTTPLPGPATSGVPPASLLPWAGPGASEPVPPAPVTRRAKLPARALRAGAAVALVAVLAAGGWVLAHWASHGSPPASVPATTRLSAVSAVAFDPYGDGPGDNSKLAPRAIDASVATAWHTDWYTNAHFGNLKPGTGLLLDMGKKVTITSARLTLGSAHDADLQLRVGTTAASLSDMPAVARAAGADGQVHLRLAVPAHGRYVLVWFTKLPRDSAGTFQASVYDVSLEGRA